VPGPDDDVSKQRAGASLKEEPRTQDDRLVNQALRCVHSWSMGKPRDDKQAAKDLARDLSEIATHIGQLKGEANAYLSDPIYERLKLRVECALSLRWRLLLWRLDVGCG
jgi:hypothetical protein